MDAKGKPSASKGPIIRVLATLIAVGALAVAATTGDSWAVRSILVLVAGDVAVRLWRW